MAEPLDPDTLAQWEHWFATYMPDDAPDVDPLLAVARDHARLTAAIAEHRPPEAGDFDAGSFGVCHTCGGDWPCAVAALSAEAGDTDG